MPPPSAEAARTGRQCLDKEIDASGTFSETKRITGVLRMLEAGVILIDYSTVTVEITADNANPKARDVYPAIDMPFATLVGQLFGAYTTTLARK